MCTCPQRRVKPIYSYHFVCTYPVPKPWSDIRTPLYSQGVENCVKEIYHLWYRMFAKALNIHKYLNPSLKESILEEEYTAIEDTAANRVEW